MILDGLLHLPLLDPDVALGHGGAAVLEKLLDQGNVVAVVPVDFRGIILSEAVGADALNAQIITDYLQLPLNRPLCQREDDGIGRDPVVQTIAADKLIEGQRHSEHSGLSGFLLRDGQPVPLTVADDVIQPQPDDVRDPQAQIGFQHQGCSHSLIRSASGKPLLHGRDDLFVLLRSQCNSALIHRSYHLLSAVPKYEVFAFK